MSYFYEYSASTPCHKLDMPINVMAMQTLIYSLATITIARKYESHEHYIQGLFESNQLCRSLIFLLTILLSSNTHTCDMHGIFFIDHYYVQDCNILELQRLITIPRKDN